jgi:hypothetical protein
VHAVNTTPAYLFRIVSDEAGLPTILYDEIDTLFGPKAKDNEDIRGMLNAGHRRGAVAGRCITKGRTVETEELPAYCAVALAGLDDLPDTIGTRSVKIRMRRRAPNERVEPWRHRVNAPQADPIAKDLARWAETSEVQWPDMPDGIEDRDADVWEPLLAMAGLAGGDWPKRARVAAVALVADSRDGKTGKGLDSRGLASRLRKYDIHPKDVRLGEDVRKGYKAEDLADSWSRYLQSLPEVVMRMMLKAVFDTEAASEVMSSGQGREVNRRVVDRFQPEAFYAFTDDGQRAILMVFDMADTSQIPMLTEPMFQQGKAKVTLTPCMNLEDLEKGFEELASQMEAMQGQSTE